MMDYALGIIGAGNMAEAVIRGALAGGLLEARQIVASDISEARRAVAAALGVHSQADNHLPASCPRVLLAVKPQMMATALNDIAADIRPDALVISIAAGVTTATIDTRLHGRGRIVRVMPNTPMLVGEGASALCAGPRANSEDLAWTRQLFAAGGGLAVVVSDEALMDAVTAVSGSGPAYFFYLVEAMVEAGVAEGLPHQTALELARQTCLGAAKLMVHSGEQPQALRARVTSPNGTTQRAIETMDAAGVKASLVAAVRAAAARGRELGRQ
jgi:pyrroline-5-carboxylate reductase